MRLFGKRVARGVSLPESLGAFRQFLLLTHEYSPKALMHLPVVSSCLALKINRLIMAKRRVVDENGRELPTPQWLQRPNEITTFDDFIASAIVSLDLYGNWYVLPLKDKAGKIAGCFVPHPTDVEPFVQTNNEVIWFVAGMEYKDWLIQQRAITMPGSVRGLSVFRAAERIVDIGLHAQDFVARHFMQGARLEMVVTPGEGRNSLPKEAIKPLMEQFVAKHVGPENAWRPLISNDKWNFEQFGQTASDARILELSHAARAQIAGECFHVDPTLLGIPVEGNTTLTYATAMDRENQLQRNSTRHLARRFENVVNMMLPRGQFLKLDLSDELRGTPQMRSQIVTAMALANKHNGVFLFEPDEMRDVMGLPPLGHEPMKIVLPEKDAETKKADAEAKAPKEITAGDGQ